MRASRKVVAGSALALVCGLAWTAYQEVPGRTVSAADILPGATEPAIDICTDGSRNIVQLIFIGDSNTSGSRLQARESAYPFQLAELLSPATRVEVLANGGARVSDAAVPTGDQLENAVTVIMMGTNDAAPRGWLKMNEQPTHVTEFREGLAAVARLWASATGEVVILAPPPAGSPAMRRRIAPYRQAARRAARDAGVAFLDSAVPLAAAGSSAVLQQDGLHLNDAGHRRLASWLAQCLMPDTSVPSGSQLRDA